MSVTINETSRMNGKLNEKLERSEKKKTFELMILK